MHVCAAKLQDKRAIVANGLYWAAANSEAEADYLCAILNSPITTELTRPLMSYGKDERDIHKHVWELPIPTFDPKDHAHKKLSQLGSKATELLATFEINTELHFAATRRHMREVLFSTPIGTEIDELVFEMLG